MHQSIQRVAGRAARGALLALALAMPVTLAQAGTIAGTIRDGAGRAVANKDVKVSCEVLDFEDTVKTDKDGVYVVDVPGSGACVLSVGSATYDIYAYPRPIAFDFVLSGGKLSRD